MGIYKKEKRLHDFFKLFFANNIYTKKLNEKIQKMVIVQYKIIHVMVVIFHVYIILHYISVYKHKHKKINLN
jgi:hypothetical protein